MWTLVLSAALALQTSRSDYVPLSIHLPKSNSEVELEHMNRRQFQTRINALEMPPTRNNQTLPVYVGFFIESLGDVKETEMAYHLDVYCYQNWVDSRLAHNQSLRMINDQHSLNQIWLPDLYFANAKSAYFQTVTVPNFAVYIFPDGTVAYSARITMTLSCNLDLKQYPLDSQTCMVKIQSYGHRMSEMDVRWFTIAPLQMDSDISLPEFSVTELTTEYCNGSYKYALTEHAPILRGQFSCLLAKIHLQRSVSYHLVQTYIPTGMIVVISWISFWIDPTAVPARVSLSFTTLLTLATQGTGLRYTLPPVSYAKAIDYWFGTCMLFLFAALIEFAIVNTLMRKARKFQEMVNVGTTRRQSMMPSMETAVVGDVMEHLLLHKAALSNRYAKRALAIDWWSRGLFPGSFFAFLLFYWLFYNAFSA